MSILSGLFRSRDKPTNSTNGSTYRFLFGGSNSGKAVNERSAMQMTAVYPCVRILSEFINTPTPSARKRLSSIRCIT